MSSEVARTQRKKGKKKQINGGKPRLSKKRRKKTKGRSKERKKKDIFHSTQAVRQAETLCSRGGHVELLTWARLLQLMPPRQSARRGNLPICRGRVESLKWAHILQMMAPIAIGTSFLRSRCSATRIQNHYLFLINQFLMIDSLCHGKYGISQYGIRLWFD